MGITPSSTINTAVATTSHPTFTWRVNVDNEDGMAGSISGYTDKVEAIKQQLYLLLNTQFGKYKIFAGTTYGVKKDDLIGLPIPYVIAEIDRRYTDAIKKNIPEIISVGNFSFSTVQGRRGVLCVAFDVVTIFGAYSVTNEVSM